MSAAAQFSSSQMLLHERAVLGALVSRERELKVEMLATDDGPSAQDRQKELKSAVEFLELVLAVTAINEAFASLKIVDLDDLLRRGRELERLATSIAGMDPGKVLERHRAEFEAVFRSARPVQLPAADRALQTTVRLVQSILPVFSLHDFEREATALAMNSLGMRARNAVDRLRGFVHRHDARLDDRISVAGQAYRDGRLTLDDVAAIFGVPREDVAFHLERLGFFRSVETIRLSERERTSILERLGKDRLERNGRPSPSGAAIRRDLISSQRIEGIDARAWLKPATE